MPPYAYRWSFFFLVILMPLGAAAEAPNGETEAKVKKAQAYLTLATTLFKDKDFEGALDSLQRAEPLVEKTSVRPLVRFNIARCYEEIGRPVEALAAYRRYLEMGETVERRQKRAHAAIKALRANYVGRLVVYCAPEDAEVELVGLNKKLEGCPADFGDVLAQRYTLEVTRRGYETLRQEEVVVPAKATRAQVGLTRLKPAQPIERAQVPTVDVTMETETSSAYTHLWFWGGAGLAATAGVVFHGLAVSDANSIETQAPGPARNDALDRFESKRALTLGLYGVSLALVTAALLNHPEGDNGSMSQFWVHPTGLGTSFSF